jgi:hypothetical protein
MRNSRRPIAPVEQEALDHREAYVDAADTESLAYETAITHLIEQGFQRSDASDIIEQLLLKGYLYEVGEELRIPPRW